MKKLIVVLIILSSVFTGCMIEDRIDEWWHKKPTELLPESTTGENIFSYKLNGEIINLSSISLGEVAGVYQGGFLQLGGESSNR